MDAAMNFVTLVARGKDANGVDPDHLNLNTKDPLLIQMQKKYCKVGMCPMDWATLQYRPNLIGNAIFVVLLVILLVAQLWFGIRKKTWTYMGAVSCGILGEAVGYVGRLMLNRNPFPLTNFLINLVPLTIAPALLTAGIYLCLGRVITAIGSENSRLKPKYYTYIFVGSDLISLILQAVGGYFASTAKDKKGSDLGVKIMIAGLIFQVASMVMFFTVWGNFIFRVHKVKRSGNLARTQPPLYAHLRNTQRFRWFQWSLFLATTLIFIRCLYRVIELWGGFNSYLANHELTFMLFEPPMIIGAIACMTVMHPGRVFDHLWVPAGKGVRSMKLGESESAIHLTGPSTTAYHRVEQV